MKRIVKYFKHKLFRQKTALPEVTISLFYGINQFNKTAVLQYDNAIALQIEPYHLGLYARILDPGAIMVGYSIAHEVDGVGVVLGSGRVATVFGQESKGILVDSNHHEVGHALITVRQT